MFGKYMASMGDIYVCNPLSLYLDHDEVLRRRSVEFCTMWYSSEGITLSNDGMSCFLGIWYWKDHINNSRGDLMCTNSPIFKSCMIWVIVIFVNLHSKECALYQHTWQVGLYIALVTCTYCTMWECKSINGTLRGTTRNYMNGMVQLHVKDKWTYCG